MASQKTYNRHQALLGKRPSLLMALEPRILFDGAGADVVADVSADAFLPQDSGPAPEAPAVVGAGTADAPAGEAAPATDTNTDVANAEASPAVDPAPLTTPELSGQEQAGAGRRLQSGCGFS